MHESLSFFHIAEQKLISSQQPIYTMPIFIAILSAIIYHNLYHNTAFAGDNKRQALYSRSKKGKEKLFVEKSQEDDQSNTKSSQR